MTASDSASPLLGFLFGCLFLGALGVFFLVFLAAGDGVEDGFGGDLRLWMAVSIPGPLNFGVNVPKKVSSVFCAV